jgi:transcriptional regulator with XRE-family HTH domain
MHDHLTLQTVPGSPTQAAPTLENLALRRAMKLLHLSQEELARRIREDGRDTNGCNRAMVDRWVRGKTKRPQPRYLRALERVTGLPAASLGYADQYRPDHERLIDDGTFPGGVKAVTLIAFVSLLSFQDTTSAQVRQINPRIIGLYSSEPAGLRTLPLGR